LGLPVHGELTTVRAATAEDVDLLVRWHADPEVAPFWDHETFTREEMEARLARPDVDSFLVEADGEPIGYVQAWTDDGGRTGGIDMFLVADARGRGLGPDAARALARHLRDDRGWERVSADPYTWNERAIRAWRKAGFESVEERDADDEHTAPWLLMEYRGA
jgi:aminoglycoside 6'-N-acetyltransferase